MTKVILDDSSLEDIADAIRAKNGTATTYKPNQMATAITNIPQGTDTSDATLDSNAEMLSGYTAYSNGVKYTGSIQTKTSSDLEASGATVTAPAGYYASNATKTISSGSATAPNSISGSSSTVSVSNNTVTLSKTVSVTPSVTAGYISSGTATNSSVSLSGSMTTQAAQTLYPSTSDQTISSGRYLSGTQTFKGVAIANLSAGNIKNGVTITVGDSADADRITSVTGTYTGGGSASIDTKSATNDDNTVTSISFTSMKGTPKAFFVRTSTQISSSGSTTYYYVIDMVYDGTSTEGNCFRIGSTRRVQNVTSGYSYTYSGTTLTISSSGARNIAPGSFYNGTYELTYIY